MMIRMRMMSLAAGLLAATVSMAQAPATDAVPAGSTGLCKDGTYWTGATKQGACRGHHGVKDWYASNAAPASAAAPAAAPSPVATAPVAPAPAPAPVSAPKATASAAPASTPAAGGGPGQVWVNKSSKVYHCPPDRWYGKTKNGEYMTESAAVAQGYRADHNKACH